MQPTSSPLTATTSAFESTPLNALPGFVDLVSEGGTLFGILSLGGVFTVLSIVWGLVVGFGYLLAIGLLGLYVYAATRKQMYEALNTQLLRDQEDLYDERFRGKHKSSRLDDVRNHIDSESPNDWKLAIIEADILLDEALKNHGYAGNSLGERLKSVSPQQLESLQDAWDAHKIRNRIAHQGADFVLTKRIAQETITQYQRVLAEFGIR